MEEEEEVMEQDDEDDEEYEDDDEDEDDEVDLYDNSVSQPTASENFAWEESCPVLSLKCSFGYASEQLGNLHVLERNVLLLSAGNYVRLFNIKTKVSRYLRSTGGGGISALAVHPSKEYFAVGESGYIPDVNIFKYPSLRMVKVLHAGTGEVYAAMEFFPVDCHLLATQGGSPDYQLTIWEWKKEIPLLRSRSIQQDVHRLLTCETPRDFLITCGVSHVRVWKMAHTFTGLKLQGETGKFGVIDVCDIDSCAMLPHGEVVSSSEWGNLLLWEDGLVSAEFVRKNNNCHIGRINQVLLYDLILISLGKDGYVRMWNIYDMIYAKPETCGGQVIITPSMQIRIRVQADLLHMVKATTHNDYIWFLQERDGNIRRLNLRSTAEESSSEVVLSTHGGPVWGCTASPCAHLVATAGKDGQVQIFDCLQEKQLASISFELSVTCLVWLPLSADSSAASIVCGFSQGHLKMISFGLSDESSQCEAYLSQALRPHSNLVTSLAFSFDGLMLSSGSLDETVFFFNVDDIRLTPLGWVSVLGEVRYLTWTPQNFSYTGLLVACGNGEVVELIFPLRKTDLEITRTFEITNLRARRLSFLSVKSQIRHDEELKRIKEQKRTTAPAHQDDDQEVEDTGAGLEKEHKGYNDLVDQGDEMNVEEQWEPFIPVTPSPILQVFYTSSESFFWASLGGFDAGYLYKCQLPTEGDADNYDASFKSKPVEAAAVPSSHDCPISSVTFNASGLLAFFGFQNGNVRIVQLKHPFDLSDLSAFWNLSVHDHRKGNITGLALAFDESFLATSADDGNIFIFSFSGKLEKLSQETCVLPKISTHHIIASHDLPSETPYWQEQKEIEYQNAKRKKDAEAKEGRRELLKNLKERFKILLSSNAKLPPHLQLSRQEMLINQNIYEEMEGAYSKNIETIKTRSKWSSDKIKLALDKLCGYFKSSKDSDQLTVKGFRIPHVVRSYRIGPIFPQFIKTEEMNPQQASCASSEEEIVTGEKEREQLLKPSHSDEMFDTMFKNTEQIDFVGKRAALMRLNIIKKNREKRAARRQDYLNLTKEKPPPDYEAPEDIAAIENARETLGCWRLRTDTSATSDRSLLSVDDMFQMISAHEKRIRARQREFNAKVTNLRRETNLVLQILCSLVKFMESDQAKAPVLKIMRDMTSPELELIYDSKFLEKFQKELLNRTAQDFSLTAYEEAGYQMNPGLAHRAKASTPYVYFKSLKPPFPEWVDLTISTKKIVEAAVGEVLPWEILSDSTSEESFVAWVINDQNLEPQTVDSVLNVPETSLEEELQTVERIKSRYYSDLAKETIDSIISVFDTKLQALYDERCSLDITIKRAELLYLTRLEEFHIAVTDLPIQEALCQSLLAKKQAVEENDVAIGDLTVQTKAWGNELEQVTEKLNEVFNDFENAIHVVADPVLLYVLRKQFKARRKTARNVVKDEEEDSDESTDDEMSLDSSSSSEEASETMNLRECAAKCDPDVNDTILKLKLVQLDLDDRLNLARKRFEECGKELEFAKRRTEILRNALKEAHHNIHKFIKEQLNELNNLSVVVPIYLSKMTYYPDYSLKKQVNESLIIDQRDLQKLKDRPISLKAEVVGASKDKVARRCSHSKLKHELVVLKEKQVILTRNCDDAMIKKFGRVVDLKELEKCFNPRVEFLRWRLRDDSMRFHQEIMRLEKEIKDIRYEGMAITKEQSNRYIHKAMALTKILHLEGALDKRLMLMMTPWSATSRPLRNDLAILQNLVKMQLEEIVWCRHEIAALKSKTHYPKVVLNPADNDYTP